MMGEGDEGDIQIVILPGRVCSSSVYTEEPSISLSLDWLPIGCLVLEDE